MEQRKSRRQFGLFIVGLISVAICVIVITPLGNMIKGNFPAGIVAPVTVTISTEVASPLSVSVSVINTTCADAETIDFSVVELSVSGGHPPYDLTITNSQLEQSGPYVMLLDNDPLRVKVYGGDYFRALVRSAAGEIWSGQIGLPAEVETCKTGLVPTMEPTAALITNTATPSATETIAPTPTSTSTPTATLFQWTATNTRRPRPDNTNTAVILQATATSDPEPSDTPRPQPTNTPPPRATEKSTPKSPLPTPINPNPRQCEDGKDNDGDGRTDYPDDTDCEKRSDNSE